MIDKEMNELKTMEKTLMTARLFEGFWDRWVSHGINLLEVSAVKNNLLTPEDWINAFSKLGKKHQNEAIAKQENNQRVEAETSYRLAALYYNLVYWIFPNRCSEKLDWYKKSTEITLKADLLSSVSVVRDTIKICGSSYAGRVRAPEKPKGCIIILNPIDSSKEELYSYEKHFVEAGFITISFDGPGQGETFLINGTAISKNSWKVFVDKVIDYTASKFPSQSINLFGTSSGAAWAIYGSANPKVNKVAAVSPPLDNSFSIPNYFGERVTYIAEDQQYVLPDYIDKNRISSVIIFHGNKDVMVADEDVYNFYKNMPSPKRLIEYPNEGHCCNFELHNVRELSITWFLSKG
ncbi:alpha/beta hydrolase [Terribacillus sp. JSM ZJ617]|uniref:alpha/beta hydrolase n=1 Tax=Terribacillus sp. JSM ZJ617 TaxID=3342119 RepID=UPI0035A99DE9